ncbi:MAG: hypothetical protein FWG20_00090 [Candidatus Cloacimonetes bacterium]|nr:hypothetical protein [Candidatus Cloacimonadota bacterium]
MSIEISKSALKIAIFNLHAKNIIEYEEYEEDYYYADVLFVDIVRMYFILKHLPNTLTEEEIMSIVSQIRSFVGVLYNCPNTFPYMLLLNLYLKPVVAE